MKKIIIILAMAAITVMAYGQKEMIPVYKGNHAYNKKQYDKAATEYMKGLKKNPESFSAYYNWGNALFRQGAKEEKNMDKRREKMNKAIEKYKQALNFSKDDKLREAHTFHNIGNAYLMMDSIQQSIKAYKEALRRNPKDDETRYNLAYAKKLLQKNQGGGGGDNQQQQQQQQQDQQQQQQQQQDQQQDQQQKDKQSAQQQQQQSEKMSKEQAEQILQALQQDERETQEGMQQYKRGTRRHVEKDW